MTLTRADIICNLEVSQKLTHSDSKKLVEDFFNALSDEIVKGGPVKISGFGNFTTNNKKERPGRDPKTGIVYTVDARRVATFKPGGSLKDRCKKLK